MTIERRQYSATLFVWCVVDGGAVMLCRLTEAEARQAVKELNR